MEPLLGEAWAGHQLVEKQLQELQKRPARERAVEPLLGEAWAGYQLADGQRQERPVQELVLIEVLAEVVHS
jgi:hypothetical protein